MFVPKDEIDRLVEDDILPPHRVKEALEVTQVIPKNQQIVAFIDKLLLIFGSLGIGSGVVFFVAANWDKIDKFGKFILLELLLVTSISLYVYFKDKDIISTALLSFASLVVGALLALVGQTYQTGANSYELFFYWAIMILPWVIVANKAPLWLFWVVVSNIALVLYINYIAYYHNLYTLFYYLFIYNFIIWIIWEIATIYRLTEPSRWFVRLLAYYSGFMITSYMILFIFDNKSFATIYYTLPLYIFWILGMCAFYRFKVFDIYMISGGCLSIAVIVISIFAKFLFKIGSLEFGLAVLIFVSITLSASINHYIRAIVKEHKGDIDE